MEKLLGDYKQYFRGGRLLVSQDQPIAQLPPKEIFDNMKSWVQHLLTALSVLHGESYVAGSISPQAFVVGSDDTVRLRLSPLTFRRPSESEPEYGTFNPATRFLAPERHVAIGRDDGLTARQIYRSLFEKSPTFERISTVFPTISHDVGQYQDLYEQDAVDPEQEDVWMLANSLLTVYLDLLTYDDVFATEFYREEHERFMDLLEAMLQSAPSERLTARKALLVWLSVNLSEITDGADELPEITDDDDETDGDETDGVEPSLPQPEPAGAESSPPSIPDPPTTPLPVPDAPLRRVARNRTRKNLRNSGRSSASGSRARRFRG